MANSLRNESVAPGHGALAYIECPGGDYGLHFAYCNFCRIHKTLRVTPDGV